MTVGPQLASQLRIAVARLARRLRQENVSDLTLSEQSALAALHRDGPMNLTALAAVERVKPPTVLRLVDKLEKRGMVQRAPDPSDRRGVLVSVTDEGRRLLSALRRQRDAYLAHRLRRLTSEQRATLAEAVDLMETLVEDEP